MPVKRKVTDISVNENEDSTEAVHHVHFEKQSNDSNELQERGVEEGKTVDVDTTERTWWKGYEEVWMDSVMNADYCGEQKRLSAILLHVKTNELKKSLSLYSSPKMKTQVGFGNSEIYYDRIFLFGGLGRNSCFVIISRSARQSGQLLQGFSEKECCIGQTVILIEPFYINKTLGSDSNLPIFEVKKRFEPYDFPSIPCQKYIIPQEPSTRYFVLHNTCIDVQMAVMERSKCTGYLCDRQTLKPNEKVCCCLFNNGYSSLVIEVNVKVKLDEEEMCEMQNFKSWKFTNLLIKNVNSALSVDDFNGDTELEMSTAR
jgi:hypothetical protein